jgi:hypothetical protein
MTEHDARRLTERIRIAAVNYSEAKDKLLTLVQEAKDGAAHLALDYNSWTTYLAEVMGEEPLRLARDERKEIVQLLSAEGMSTRAIAPIVGASQRTVASDVEHVSNFAHVNTQGMDGKTYTRTAPQPKPEPERDVAKDLDVINDIRLYFNAIASSRQVAGLTPKGKQHIIDAATNLITQLQRNQ